jgi:hypothetical protein
MRRAGFPCPSIILPFKKKIALFLLVATRNDAYGSAVGLNRTGGKNHKVDGKDRRK